MRISMVLILAALLLPGCLTTGTDQYAAVKDYNEKVAAHKVASIELAEDGKVKRIEFSGTPNFMRPTNQWIEGARVLLPYVHPFMGGSGVNKPTLKAGGDIIYTDRSYNTEDHRIATGGENGNITGPTDSHDATAPPVVVDQPAPVIVEQPTPVVVGDKE